MKERILDVIKWGLILVIAGGIFYFFDVKSPYTIVSNGEAVAFKMKNRTGEVWMITPMGEEFISSRNDTGKKQPLAGDKNFSGKSGPIDLGPYLKKKSPLEQAKERGEKEHQKNNE